MTDFGKDVSTFPDLDPSFTPLTGYRAVGESIARRLTTPRGALVEAPDYGIDVRDWINETQRVGSIDELQRTVIAEALREERVLEADATIAFRSSTSELHMEVSLVSSEGPFALVLDVSAISLSVIVVE